MDRLRGGTQDCSELKQKNMTITTYSQLRDFFVKHWLQKMHLHLERDCGTYSVSFAIDDGTEILGEGKLNTEVTDENDYCCFEDDLTRGLIDEFIDMFETVTEYDNLCARTNPSVIREAK